MGSSIVNIGFRRVCPRALYIVQCTASRFSGLKWCMCFETGFVVFRSVCRLFVSRSCGRSYGILFVVGASSASPASSRCCRGVLPFSISRFHVCLVVALSCSSGAVASATPYRRHLLWTTIPRSTRSLRRDSLPIRWRARCGSAA